MSVLTRLLDRLLDRAAEKVLAVMQEQKRMGWYGLELMEAAGLSAGTIYPVLVRLEKAGQVKSAWHSGSFPRRRIYWLAA